MYICIIKERYYEISKVFIINIEIRFVFKFYIYIYFYIYNAFIYRKGKKFFEYVIMRKCWVIILFFSGFFYFYRGFILCIYYENVE